MKSELPKDTASEAWQSVLAYLKVELPGVLFETWVADTQYLSSADGLVSIGCRNRCTRNWLENHLQPSVSTQLEKLLERNVEVRFVLANDQVGAVEPAEGEVEVEAVWDAVYEQVVQPEKVIALNAYFLRHLRELGPELSWMYVGFRQAAYSTGGRHGKRTARLTGKSIAVLSGTPERTFWFRAGSAETWKWLAGLVKPVEEKPLWDEKSKTPKRLPRKYSVAMTLPLTAADAGSLMRWIALHLEEAGGPALVLKKACGTPLTELIPPSAESRADSEPMAVGRIVRDLFAEELPEMELNALAERLRIHLMPPGDLVMISLFFVEHVLPHLGAGPGWMLTILRDRCWVNPENGETRNRVTVKGGYAEVAGWMGLERPLTVYEWLNGKHRKMLPAKGEHGEKGQKPNPKAGQYLNPGVRMYVREANRSKALAFNAGQREFEVLLDEIPAEIVSAAILGQPLFPFENDPSLYANCSIGLTRIADDFYATCSLDFTRIAEDLYALCRVFTLLSSFKPALKTLLKPTPENSEKSEASTPGLQKPVVVDQWDLGLLFRANGVSRKKQQQLFASGATGLAFASRLLYGYTLAGKGLTDLVGNAIQSTLSNPEAGAGGICDLLAEHGPTKLATWLTDSLRGATVAAPGFPSALDHLSATQKQELLMRLGQKSVEIQERLPVYEPPLFGLRHVADRQIRNVLQERAGKANSKNGKGA
ncbi:MAG: hypothetical protein NT121_14455 [Chloroflexi bacterium]|nr:hypothetical protein [Chloroflexota bacterium]